MHPTPHLQHANESVAGTSNKTHPRLSSTLSQPSCSTHLRLKSPPRCLAQDLDFRLFRAIVPYHLHQTRLRSLNQCTQTPILNTRIVLSHWSSTFPWWR